MSQNAPEHGSLPSRSSPLDLLRTIAIALVFTSHYRNFASHDWFDTIGSFGWAGVDLFFVLSGFLIASQLLKSVAHGERFSWTEFYLRRGLRIWPSYFAVLALYLAVPAFIERSQLADLWRYVTFTLNFGLDYTKTGAFSHAWSLCVEEQFYLALPIVLVAAARWGNARRVGILVACTLLGGMALRSQLWLDRVSPLFPPPEHRGLSAAFFREIYYPTYCRLDGLMLGVLLATLYRLRPTAWSRLTRRGNSFLIAGLVAILGSYFLTDDEFSWSSSTFGYPLLALGFASLLVAALAPTSWLGRLRVPGVRWTATLAFSFYLTHKQMIHLAKQWLTDAGVQPASALFPVLVILICLAASALLYGIIERPFLQLRDRWIVRRNAAIKMTSQSAPPAVPALPGDL